VGRDIIERGSNRGQIAQGTASLESGSQELKTFSTHLSKLKNASAQQHTASANQQLAELQQLMLVELDQGTYRAESMKRELAGSASETGSNRRESRRNRDDSDAFGRTSDDEADALRDGLNRVDDVHDVADDKSDLAALGERLNRQQQIAQYLDGYQFALNTPAGRHDSSRRISALEDFGGLMQQELKAIEAEINEDRREAAEDRRETRDDFREADELDNRFRRETGNRGRRRGR